MDQFPLSESGHLPGVKLCSVGSCPSQLVSPALVRDNCRTVRDKLSPLTGRVGSGSSLTLAIGLFVDRGSVPGPLKFPFEYNEKVGWIFLKAFSALPSLTVAICQVLSSVWQWEAPYRPNPI